MLRAVAGLEDTHQEAIFYDFLDRDTTGVWTWGLTAIVCGESATFIFQLYVLEVNKADKSVNLSHW